MLNSAYGTAATPEGVLGVANNFLSPPELATLDVATGMVRHVSDLNPELRKRRFGRVQQFYWRSPNEERAYGLLILPPDATPGKRVPILMLFDRDHTTWPELRRFAVTGPDCCTGAIPIQTLANAGIAVFLMRGSKAAVKMRQVVGEGPEMVADYESAIEALATAGFIDKSRIGLSGWSYGGQVTDFLLLWSKTPFAAASKIDGGSAYYAEKRRWRREELSNITAPVLLEAHGPHSLLHASVFADNLAFLDKPVDVLYFATSPHATVTPKHRWRSMTVNTDWFRFWLQDYEDPDPEKRDQYFRWRKLREQRDSNARKLP